MKISIKITGMHCDSCKKLIEDVASESPGVISCTVDPVTGQGAIEHDEAFDFAKFAEEVAGFDNYHVEKI